MEQTVPATELISRTENIVLAKATSAKLQNDGWNVLYNFKTIRSLKGSTTNEFSVIGVPPYGGSMNSFNHHKAKGFWLDYGGRESNDTDCRIKPTFGVGVTYLIFIGSPYHRKSFEIIIRTHGSAKDKWLQYVEKLTPNKSPNQIGADSAPPG